MTDNLYIIGNGFDLHHGVPSRFQDFAAFLAKENIKTYKLVCEYLPVDSDFWGEFEQRLAEFDLDHLLDHAINYLVPYGSEDWSDWYHHSTQHEVRGVVEALSQDLKSTFSRWVGQLPQPNLIECNDRLLRLDRSAKYLSFNYTPTLSNIYGIPPTQITHIHGRSGDDIVIGHGWDPDEATRPHASVEGDDVRMAEANDIAHGYFKETYKPTSDIIHRHSSFFQSLGDVRHINVLGHSLSDVDAAYFSEILRMLRPRQVAWTVSYFDNLDEIQSRFEALVTPYASVQFCPLSSFKAVP